MSLKTNVWIAFLWFNWPRIVSIVWRNLYSVRQLNKSQFSSINLRQKQHLRNENKANEFSLTPTEGAHSIPCSYKSHARLGNGTPDGILRHP